MDASYALPQTVTVQPITIFRLRAYLKCSSHVIDKNLSSESSSDRTQASKLKKQRMDKVEKVQYIWKNVNLDVLN